MEGHVSRSANLSVGAQIMAARDFGPIVAGQFGMITGKAAKRHFLRWRTQYSCLCTFLGDIRVVALRTDIAHLDHGCSQKTTEDSLWFFHSHGAGGSYAHAHAWDILRRDRPECQPGWPRTILRARCQRGLPDSGIVRIERQARTMMLRTGSERVPLLLAASSPALRPQVRNSPTISSSIRVRRRGCRERCVSDSFDPVCSLPPLFLSLLRRKYPQWRGHGWS